jgi:hypothetical protein
MWWNFSVTSCACTNDIALNAAAAPTKRQIADFITSSKKTNFAQPRIWAASNAIVPEIATSYAADASTLKPNGC